jgi:PEP-CTERM motif
MKLRSFALSLAALLLAGGASAQNLIVNGGFESSNVGANGYVYVHNAAWNNPSVVATGWDFAENTGAGVINRNWGSWGGMAGLSAVGFLQDHPLFNGAAPVISQTFASNAISYSVAFDLGQRGGNNAQDVVVKLDGMVLGSGAITAPGGYGTRYSFDIAGLTGNSHTLSFTSLFSSGDQTAFVDNVSVTALAFPTAAVPEPASLGLMALGLAGIGLRRRQRTASR